MTLQVTRKTLCIAGTSISMLGALIGYAAAEGAPTMQPLFYSGLVTSKEGVPLSDSHSVSLSLFAAQSGGSAVCATPPVTASFTAGRFRVALPSGDKGCAQAVSKNPDTWVEVTVDDATFPRTKVGAMPYAIESGHAKSASSVTGAQADTLTQLSSSVMALQASVGAAPTQQPPAPAAAGLTYRFIKEGAGCAYSATINSTVCSCNPGELIVSAGGWAGSNGVLNASRAQHGPDDVGANDSDRAREWTISCTTLTGAPIQCQRVQAVCLKG